VSARDKKTGKKVAIKKVSNTFNDLLEAKRILREVKMLRHLNHSNLCEIVDLIPPSSKNSFSDVYLVLGYMETDLHKIIYSKNNKLTEDHHKYFLYQLFKALKFLHSAGIIHRDLKPSNILLNGNCDLKICDFGLARAVDDNEPNKTVYVVTRWYRAPEIMMGQDYGALIDVWAAGCIYGEMIGKTPLLNGSNYMKQLQLILNVLGVPTRQELSWVDNPKAVNWICTLSGKRVPFQTLFPNYRSKRGLDFLEKLLVFNPANRMTVQQALEHPFLSKSSHYHKKEQTTCKKTFDMSYETPTIEIEDIRTLMYNEILEMRTLI